SRFEAARRTYRIGSTLARTAAPIPARIEWDTIATTANATVARNTLARTMVPTVTRFRPDRSLKRRSGSTSWGHRDNNASSGPSVLRASGVFARLTVNTFAARFFNRRRTARSSCSSRRSTNAQYAPKTLARTTRKTTAASNISASSPDLLDVLEHFRRQQDAG